MSRAVMEILGASFLSLRRAPPGGVGEEEELHQVVLHRGDKGLDDEDVPLPQAFLVADEEVVVGEAQGGALAQGEA